MKLFIILALLTVVGFAAAVPVAELDITSEVEYQNETDVVDRAVVPFDRANRLLLRRQFVAYAANNVIRVLNYTWRGLASTRISGWRVLRVGSAQGATVTRTGGGVGSNFLALRFQSARGRGFNFIVEIYGR